ncbi:hypothetical protein ATANTOWER_003672 [Ataeniobius toweri]|uniref:Integrase core domain-containing protein n=1 Tax=Ataeniobius toweri TaxID=208326 RepID=A0ABU7C632_9TELE|nr:hypothetical protein [Ataeniobius toweri]
MENQTGRSQAEESMLHQLLQRVRHRVISTLNRQPIDFHYLYFVCCQELQFLRAGAAYVDLAESVVENFQRLTEVVSSYTSAHASGNAGRPKVNIESQTLTDLLSSGLPLTSLCSLSGIARSTLYRRLKEHDLSVRKCYSSISDDSLDQKVRCIKTRMPNAGYRLVKGSLQAMGVRIPWKRVKMSLQRMDGAGLIARMVQLSCIARRQYCVPAPLSLVHVDTNHKLIRYNIIVFGAIDGFSRKIFYLDTAGNNKAGTAFCFFMDGVCKHG